MKAFIGRLICFFFELISRGESGESLSASPGESAGGDVSEGDGLLDEPEDSSHGLVSLLFAGVCINIISKVELTREFFSLPSGHKLQTCCRQSLLLYKR